MRYVRQWQEGRKQAKKVKKESLEELSNKFADSEDCKKLKRLIDLYLDSHDLVTKIGSEISLLAEKEFKQNK